MKRSVRGQPSKRYIYQTKATDFNMSEPEFLLPSWNDTWLVRLCVLLARQEINKGKLVLMNGSRQHQKALWTGRYVSDRLTGRDTFGELPDLTGDSMQLGLHPFYFYARSVKLCRFRCIDA